MGLFVEYHVWLQWWGLVLMVLAPDIELLAALSSATPKPNAPLKTAAVPAAACVLQCRISSLYAVIQLLGFFFVLVCILRNLKGNLTVGEDSVFLICACVCL